MKTLAYIFGGLAFLLCASITIAITAVFIKLVTRKPLSTVGDMPDSIGYDDNDLGVDVD